MAELKKSLILKPAGGPATVTTPGESPLGPKVPEGLAFVGFATMDWKNAVLPATVSTVKVAETLPVLSVLRVMLVAPFEKTAGSCEFAP
jgi:hypothetical protein